MGRRLLRLQIGDGLAAQTHPLHGVRFVCLTHTVRTYRQHVVDPILPMTERTRLTVSVESMVLVLVIVVVLLLMLALSRFIAISVNDMFLELPDGGELIEGTGDTPRERAEALLCEVLDEHEYQQVRKQGYVDVVSPSNAQRIYRIPRFWGRVSVYEGGQVVRELCIQPIEPIPSADVIVMHKLMIQGNEEQYLAQANQFSALIPGRRYQP